ncbi:hypothetical protein [Streptomyces sp. NPDC058657]|uniref:hypothetical protein n=1 Tax=unclassified Streptomyces TaxID=2593676 RepID=UPI00365BA39C
MFRFRRGPGTPARTAPGPASAPPSAAAAAVALAASAALLLTACGTQQQGGPPAIRTSETAPGVATATKPCPKMDLSHGGAPPALVQGSIPANTPEAQALARAFSPPKRGGGPYARYADIYSDFIVDQPHGRVVLCVTDLKRGKEWVEAVRRSHPDVDTTRVDLYRGRYAHVRVAAAGERLHDWKKYAHPIHTVSIDGSDLTVGSSPAGAASKEFREQLTKDAGVAVRVEAGSPAEAAGGDMPRGPQPAYRQPNAPAGPSS